MVLKIFFYCATVQAKDWKPLLQFCCYSMFLIFNSPFNCSTSADGRTSVYTFSALKRWTIREIFYLWPPRKISLGRYLRTSGNFLTWINHPLSRPTRRNLKSQRSPIIVVLEENSVREITWLLFSQSSALTMFSVHTKTQSQRFQIPPVWRAFSKSFVFWPLALSRNAALSLRERSVALQRQGSELD